jgi:hypothetical protein
MTRQITVAAQYARIVAMVDALNCDYDRLEELRRACYEFDGPADKWADANPDDAEELAELEAAAGDCTSEDAAHERIQEDPLDVSVRSGWENLGATLTPSEFRILLCTGGPAVQICGDLDNNRPTRAWLEYQDWGTPWTQYFDAAQDTLIRYASEFYFGE